MYITKKCPNFLTLKLKRNTYLFKRDSYAAGSSRPCCEIRFPCYSSRWISLIGHPVYWREAVCKIFVLSSSSNTGSKLSDVNAFDPRCSSFMYPIGIRVVEVVHSELHVNFLKRIEYERFELDHNTLILYPERRIWKLVSSFLHREIYSWTEITTTKTIKKIHVLAIRKGALQLSSEFESEWAQPYQMDRQSSDCRKITYSSYHVIDEVASIFSCSSKFWRVLS